MEGDEVTPDEQQLEVLEDIWLKAGEIDLDEASLLDAGYKVTHRRKHHKKRKNMPPVEVDPLAKRKRGRPPKTEDEYLCGYRINSAPKPCAPVMPVTTSNGAGNNVTGGIVNGEQQLKQHEFLELLSKNKIQQNPQRNNCKCLFIVVGTGTKKLIKN